MTQRVERGGQIDPGRRIRFLHCADHGNPLRPGTQQATKLGFREYYLADMRSEHSSIPIKIR